MNKISQSYCLLGKGNWPWSHISWALFVFFIHIQVYTSTLIVPVYDHGNDLEKKKPKNSS